MGNSKYKNWLQKSKAELHLHVHAHITHVLYGFMEKKKKQVLLFPFGGIVRLEFHSIISHPGTPWVLIAYGS